MCLVCAGIEIIARDGKGVVASSCQRGEVDQEEPAQTTRGIENLHGTIDLYLSQ